MGNLAFTKVFIQRVDCMKVARPNFYITVEGVRRGSKGTRPIYN